MAYNPPIGSIYLLYTTYIYCLLGGEKYYRSHLLGEPETTIDQVPPSFQSKSCKDSSSDEEVEAPAIASDSDEEVVFTKPNVAGSSAAPKNEDVQMAKVVAISEKKGNLGD